MTDTLHNAPIVLDNGSGTIRAGFAGEDLPKCYFPSYVGRPKHVRVLAGALEGDIFIGQRAQELRGLLKIRYPLEHGIVTDWDDMERIWQFVYTEELKTLSEEHPVLLTEPPLNPRANRDTAAQLLFETFNVPALYTSIQAVLSLYASGRTTGVVLDAGDGVSHAVPVYEGFAMPNSIRRIDVAGRDVTEHMQMLFRKSGLVFHTSAEKEVVRMIKEKTCYVAPDPKKEDREWAQNNGRPEGKVLEYALPDGQRIKVGSERWKAPEILFDPEIIGLEYPGIHQIVVDAINRTDMDLRKSLFGNIVLSGGSTLCKGFGDRLLHEVQRLAVKDMRIKIFAPPERKYSTWIGGSILAGLSTFRKMWVSIDDWHEDPEVIHKSRKHDNIVANSGCGFFHEMGFGMRADAQRIHSSVGSVDRGPDRDEWTADVGLSVGPHEPKPAASKAAEEALIQSSETVCITAKYLCPLSLPTKPATMPFSLRLSEPHPTTTSSTRLPTGRGGVGNFTRPAPPSALPSTTTTVDSSSSSIFSSGSSKNSKFATGRGGAGNFHSAQEQRPMFKFDEELERERRHAEAVPVYHVGRGGVGNLINEMGSGRRDSDASDRSTASRPSWDLLKRS
ncbi:MAG: hypothetical protein Q9176_000981 [Flavoplaca citrina]